MSKILPVGASTLFKTFTYLNQNKYYFEIFSFIKVKFLLFSVRYIDSRERSSVPNKIKLSVGYFPETTLLETRVLCECKPSVCTLIIWVKGTLELSISDSTFWSSDLSKYWVILKNFIFYRQKATKPQREKNRSSDGLREKRKPHQSIY